MANKFPNQNLDPGSQAWARTVESRINQLGEGRSNDNTWQTMGNSATATTLARLSEQVRQLQNNSDVASGQFFSFMDVTFTNMIDLDLVKPEWASKVILSVQATLTSMTTNTGGGAVRGFGELYINDTLSGTVNVDSPMVNYAMNTQMIPFASSISDLFDGPLNVRLDFRDTGSGGVNANLTSYMTATAFWYPGN